MAKVVGLENGRNPILELTDPDMAWCQEVYDARMLNCRRLAALGYTETYGAGADGVDVSERYWLGTFGEFAAASYFGLEWTGAYERGRIDVGDCMEVRAIGKPWLKLIVHPADLPILPCVLVHVDLPHCVLKGWDWGTAIQRPRFWCDPSRKDRWAFFYPQKLLRPIGELCAIIPDLIQDAADLGLSSYRHKTDRTPQRKDLFHASDRKPRDGHERPSFH